MGVIPIHNRAKQVVTYATVDDQDVERLSQFNWWLHTGGYAARSKNRRTWFMHWDVLGERSSALREPDHRNRNRLDNRRENLRWLTPAENQQNRTTQKRSRSGVRGVYRAQGDKGWIGEVRQHGRRIWRGYFRTLQEAGIAIRAARTALLPAAVEVV